MKTVAIHKAQPTGEPIESVTIVIDAEWPEPYKGSLAECLAEFEAEATALHDALRAALPGGTLDRLAVKLASSCLVSSLVIRPQDAKK